VQIQERKCILNPKLKEKTLESLSAVLPITGIVLFISIFLVPMDLGTTFMFLSGAVMLIIGMGFFQLGAAMIKMLHKQLKPDLVNSGIAFTIPLTGATNLLYKIMNSTQENAKLPVKERVKIKCQMKNIR